MKKQYHLRDAESFRVLFRRGRRLHSPLFQIVAEKNALGRPRFAFIVSRSVEKRASSRNRIRRRAREWVRTHLPLLKSPLDVAIIFKKEAVRASRSVFYMKLHEKIFKVFRA